MRSFLLALSVALIFGCSLAIKPSQSLSRLQDSSDEGYYPFVRHFVSFRFLPNVTAEEQDEVMDRFLNLFWECVNPDTGLPYIVSLDAGYANSPEGQDQGMQQGYIVTFRNIQDRNYYVGQPFYSPYDPHHDAFKQFVGPLLQPTDGVFVFDYSAILPY